MFLLVPAYPGCPGLKAVKRSLLLLLLYVKVAYDNLDNKQRYDVDDDDDQLVWFGDCVMDVCIVLYHVRVKAPPSKVGC